jgi:hypothetical protein
MQIGVGQSLGDIDGKGGGRGDGIDVRMVPRYVLTDEDRGI